MESDFVAFPFIIGKAIYKKGKFTQGFWRFAGFPCIDSGFQAQTSTIFKYSSTHDSHHAVIRNGVFIPFVYDAPLNYSPFISQPYSIPLRLYNYQIFAD